MRTVEAVCNLIEKPISELGYSLYDIDFLKQREGYVLTVYIENPDMSSVTLDDCEKVSRAIDPLLDENDLIEQSYYLCVSSVGLDRPIKSDKDFTRNCGKIVDVSFYVKSEFGKSVTGELVSFDKDTFVLLVTQKNEKKESVIARKDAARISCHIDFD